MKHLLAIMIIMILSINLQSSNGSILSEFAGGANISGQIGVAGTNNLSQSIINSAISSWNQCGGIAPRFSTSGGSAFVAITLFDSKPEDQGIFATAQSFFHKMVTTKEGLLKCGHMTQTVCHFQIKS